MMETTIHPIDILLHKRDGRELSKEEIEHFVRTVVLNGEAKLAADPAAFVAGLRETDRISDAQIGAFLMAVFQKGLSREELGHLTMAMRYSGDVFDAAPL